MNTVVSTPDIRSILDRISLDCEESFSRLHSSFSPKMYRVASYYTGCNEMAKEVVNDVFVKVWQNRQKLPEINNIENYLFISTKNQSLNYIQKYRKVKFSTIEEVSPTYYRTNMSPESEYLRNELGNKIENAVDQLPGRCKLIYKMVREDGLKHKQVADELGISVKTIEAQIGIAFKKLNKQLVTYYDI